ncbi:type II toxin-antitoxin system PrlF family antitoxin [Siccirubricoccus sp. KC 17139]|uniref:Type II toxin-antitoxin system PrlF family antitoxin n=1 Tax=Siccirubricoccus soli TaxID=2899147 RepID=A0ABT1DB88_9PROT|nr:type II toxin-antitoxin system PrlF family antitoxin [Siccirubricoccus soli]MCO6419203.1 type II toxin-antitoxin system PrlF family antitoxin [Siccirubricoccus soli]MCP2685338.1 type II toxin-antitoxin system PrlF family antitoxin [Siccirubricoccus soli]
MGMPVTIKGQVTIPKPIRDRLGITPGQSEVEFELQPDGQVVLRRAAASPPIADRFARFLGKPPAGWNGMTTEEIMRLTRGEDWGDAG